MSFKTSVPLLSKEETVKFINQVDLACRLLDAQFLKGVVQKFSLNELEDSVDFLSDAIDNLEFWKRKKSVVRVKEVKKFDTNCIACVFGKKVNGYLVSYSEERQEGFKINFEKQFAVNYQLEDGQLTDFGWCHAFLNKKEIDQLHK